MGIGYARIVNPEPRFLTKEKCLAHCKNQAALSEYTKYMVYWPTALDDRAARQSEQPQMRYQMLLCKPFVGYLSVWEVKPNGDVNKID